MNDEADARTTEHARPATDARFADVLALVRRLRAPGGCDWDRAQTAESLLPYLLEEVYEVRQAVLERREGELAAELGDLALHLAFQCVLAEERSAFDAGAVLRGVIDKMVRRHPHVFGAREDGAAAGRLAAEDHPPAGGHLHWEEMKRTERPPGSAGGRTLGSVPHALPALLKAQRLQERAAGVGFDWPDVDGAVDKVTEELDELRGVLRGARDRDAAVEEELGDLLFAVVNVARRAGVSAEDALERASSKFARRFARMEALAEERGLAVDSAGLAALDDLWEEVKRGEHSSGAV